MLLLPPKALYLRKRALHLRKRAQYLRKRVLYLRKRALYLHKRALYLHKRALYLRKRVLYLHKRAPHCRTHRALMLPLGSCTSFLSQKPYISAKELCISAKELSVFAKEPYTSAYTELFCCQSALAHFKAKYYYVFGAQKSSVFPHKSPVSPQKNPTLPHICRALWLSLSYMQHILSLSKDLNPKP